MRKRSKSKHLIDKTDKVLQDYYRALNLRCEVCGARAEVIHHFIEKSKSNYLRYVDINLIPLCKRCHFRHHNCGDATIHAKIILKRGQEWLKELLRLAKIKRQHWSKQELEDIYLFYKKKIEELE